MISNLTTIHFQKRETCLKWLMLGVAYFVAFGFIENPMTYTISTIGKEHHWLFAGFCVLLPMAYLTNFLYTYRVYDIKSKLWKILGFYNVAFGLTCTTLLTNGSNDISLFATIVHWVVGFGSIVLNTVISLVLLLKVAKKTKSKIQKLGFIIGTVIAAGDGLAFILAVVITRNPQVAKNGLFEIVPCLVTFAAIYLTNHIDGNFSRAERDSKDNALEPMVKDKLTAGAFLFLVASAVSFTTFAFIRNPISYTISMTGVQYTAAFNIVCVILVVAYVLNYLLMFKKYEYKNSFIRIMSIIGSCALILCVAQKTTLDNDTIPVFHQIGALAFFYITMFTVLIFCIQMRKKGKKFLSYGVGMGAIIVITTLITALEFLVFKNNFGETGRTGITELLPILYCFFLFYKMNFALPKDSKSA